MNETHHFPTLQAPSEQSFTPAADSFYDMYIFQDSSKKTHLKLPTGKGLFFKNQGFSLCLQLLLKSQLPFPHLRCPDLNVHTLFSSPPSQSAQEMISHGQAARAGAGQQIQAAQTNPPLPEEGEWPQG